MILNLIPSGKRSLDCDEGIMHRDLRLRNIGNYSHDTKDPQSQSSRKCHKFWRMITQSASLTWEKQKLRVSKGKKRFQEKNPDCFPLKRCFSIPSETPTISFAGDHNEIVRATLLNTLTWLRKHYWRAVIM